MHVVTSTERRNRMRGSGEELPAFPRQAVRRRTVLLGGTLIALGGLTSACGRFVSDDEWPKPELWTNLGDRGLDRDRFAEIVGGTVTEVPENVGTLTNQWFRARVLAVGTRREQLPTMDPPLTWEETDIHELGGVQAPREDEDLVLALLDVERGDREWTYPDYYPGFLEVHNVDQQTRRSQRKATVNPYPQDLLTSEDGYVLHPGIPTTSLLVTKAELVEDVVLLPNRDGAAAPALSLRTLEIVTLLPRAEQS
jgi:hypothetical protein